MTETTKKDLFRQIIEKSSLKQLVYRNTLGVFEHFKEIVKNLSNEYAKQSIEERKKIPFEYKDKGNAEFQLIFGGDVLLFRMHTNVFEFSRHHEVMKTSYIKNNKNSSYCGIISIYNFLADSFKYNRIFDAGYMIGRVFINNELHYFIEGKQEIGLLYNNFSKAVIDKEEAKQIILSAINYTLNFDLLIPPYDHVKEVSVKAIRDFRTDDKLKTAKRMGYKFQADQ